MSYTTMVAAGCMLRVHRLAEDLAAAGTSGADREVLALLLGDLREAVTALGAAARAESRDVVRGVRS